MPLSYRKILEQALDITFRYKFLWFLGLFLFITQGAVISAAQKAKDKEPLTLDKAWGASKDRVGEIIGLNFVAACLSLISVAVLLAPPYFLSELGMPGKATVLIVLAFIILVPLLMIIFFSSVFGAAFVVIGRMNLKDALRSGFELFLRNWLQVLPLGLFALLVNMAFGYVTAVVLHPVTVIFIAVLGGIISAWHTVLWALVWFELIKPEKAKNGQEKLVISEAPAVD